MTKYMIKHSTIRLMVVAALAIMLPACSIPLLTTKKADTSLPASYANAAQNADSTNTANINWKEFFEDPNLSSLIDIAIVNNKEVNILAQRINIAKNEIQARKGEYLPFVNLVRVPM